MTKDKQHKSELDREEFGSDLSPDDLDFRRDNELTKEQSKNSNVETLKRERKIISLNDE